MAMLLQLKTHRDKPVMENVVDEIDKVQTQLKRSIFGSHPAAQCTQHS